MYIYIWGYIACISYRCAAFLDTYAASEGHDPEEVQSVRSRQSLNPKTLLKPHVSPAIVTCPEALNPRP